MCYYVNSSSCSDFKVSHSGLCDLGFGLIFFFRLFFFSSPLASCVPARHRELDQSAAAEGAFLFSGVWLIVPDCQELLLCALLLLGLQTVQAGSFTLSQPDSLARPLLWHPTLWRHRLHLKVLCGPPPRSKRVNIKTVLLITTCCCTFAPPEDSHNLPSDST